jgi:hypothetical protein
VDALRGRCINNELSDFNRRHVNSIDGTLFSKSLGLTCFITSLLVSHASSMIRVNVSVKRGHAGRASHGSDMRVIERGV